MDEDSGSQEIQSWEPTSVIKERIIDRSLVIALALASVAFILGSIVSPTYAFSPGFYFDILCIVGLIIVVLLRFRIGLSFKIWYVIAFVYCLFISSLLQYGTVSTQLPLSVLVPFIAALAFNFRTSLIVLVWVTISFGIVAFLYTSGLIESRIENPLNNLVTLWVSTIVVFVVASSVVILLMNRYNEEMNTIVKKLKKRDKELVGHLEEKNVMIQDIHHRVKNNLAVVSGLLELQMLSIEDPELQRTMQKSVNRILSIAKVHEKLYQSEDFNKIPFKEYVDDLTTVILDSMNSERLNIQFESQIEANFLSVNKGVPLGIIFNELITNSIKYGFSADKNNQIKITVAEKEGLVHTTYEDNGVGIENFEEASSKSLGFSIIGSLLAQMKAEYKYDTENGFKLSFSFAP
ncbi:MAG: histidine kinase dimerization/phosphoacceptor domain -containing protein [Balneola sp.]